MFGVSLIVGILVAAFFAALAIFAGRFARSHWVTGGLSILAIAIGAIAFRYAGPWVGLTLAMRMSGNPLYAIAQQNADAADVIKLQLYNAYMAGGEAAMREKAQELGREYLREANVFAAVAEADNATVEEAFLLFKMIVARGAASAPEKCGQFLSRAPGVTAHDLGLTPEEKAQANETITKIISLPRPDGVQNDGAGRRPRGALRDIWERGGGYEIFNRAPSEMSPADYAEKCRVVSEILTNAERLPPVIRVQALRGLFTRMGGT